MEEPGKSQESLKTFSIAIFGSREKILARPNFRPVGGVRKEGRMEVSDLRRREEANSTKNQLGGERPAEYAIFQFYWKRTFGI